MIGFDLKNDRERFTVSDSGIVVVPRSYRFVGNARRVSAIDSTGDPVEPITHPQAKSTIAE
jgi:hypothetical protein